VSVVSTTSLVSVKPSVDQIADSVKADAKRLQTFGLYWVLGIAVVTLTYLAIEAVVSAFSNLKFLQVFPNLASIAADSLSKPANAVIGYVDSIRFELGIAALFVATVLAIGLVLVFAQWRDNRRSSGR